MAKNFMLYGSSPDALAAQQSGYDAYYSRADEANRAAWEQAQARQLQLQEQARAQDDAARRYDQENRVNLWRFQQGDAIRAREEADRNQNRADNLALRKEAQDPNRLNFDFYSRNPTAIPKAGKGFDEATAGLTPKQIKQLSNYRSGMDEQDAKIEKQNETLKTERAHDVNRKNVITLIEANPNADHDAIIKANPMSAEHEQEVRALSASVRKPIAQKFDEIDSAVQTLNDKLRTERGIKTLDDIIENSSLHLSSPFNAFTTASGSRFATGGLDQYKAERTALKKKLDTLTLEASDIETQIKNPKNELSLIIHRSGKTGFYESKVPKPDWMKAPPSLSHFSNTPIAPSQPFTEDGDYKAPPNLTAYSATNAPVIDVPATVTPVTQTTRVITPEIARGFLMKANGDKDVARKMAAQAGYQF